jgi:hypothetical protein
MWRDGFVHRKDLDLMLGVTLCAPNRSHRPVNAPIPALAALDTFVYTLRSSSLVAEVVHSHRSSRPQSLSDAVAQTGLEKMTGNAKDDVVMYPRQGEHRNLNNKQIAVNIRQIIPWKSKRP